MDKPARLKFVAILCLAGGCAGLPDDLAPARESWRGASLQEIVARWGTPTATRTLADGALEHTWVSEAYQKVRPSAGVVIGSGGAVIGGNVPFGSAGPAVRCDRTFIFRGGVAAEGRWMGPYDYCNTFRR